MRHAFAAGCRGGFLLRAIFACLFFVLSIAGQAVQTFLLYCAITGYYLPMKLAVLLFFPSFILTYWTNLIFDALITTKKETYTGGRSGMVVRAKNTVFPPVVKKILRVITNLWTVGILALWIYYFVKFSLWNLF